MTLGLDHHQAALLRKVVADTADTGNQFFRSLTRSLAQGLGVRYCFITECVDHPASRVRTLAFWAGSEFLASFEYALLATPCDAVISGECCLYGEDIQQLFSEDEDLVALEAESYAAVPLSNTRGQVIGHLAVLDDKPFGESMQDLTPLNLFADRAAAEMERLRATQRLASSEARLRQVIDLVPHFIFAKDQEGRFILTNQALADVFGVSVDEMIGKTDAQLCAVPDEIENFRLDDLEVLRKNRSKVVEEETITDESGQVRYLHTTKIPFSTADSELPAVLGVAVDITESRNLRQRLDWILKGTAGSLGEAFLRSLTRHLAAALDARFAVVAQVDGERVFSRAVWAGDDFVEGLEYPLVGSPCEQVVGSTEVVCFADRLQARFPASELMVQLGAESYLGSPLINSDGEAIGILAVLDVKPMTETAEDYNLLSIFASRAAAELEREEVETQRQKLQDQLLHVQKLESLGVLAGGIAHDFNNMLSAILGNVALAQGSVDEQSPMATYLRGIEVAAQRSAELSQQMLAYSGKGRFVVEPLDVNQLIEGLVPLLTTSISKKAVLDLDLGANLPLIEGDATQLRQVVMNLIINGSDAIGDRVGKIRVKTGHREVDRSFLARTYLDESQAAGPYLFLEVSDDGCGMTPETRERLFDPFFTTKEAGRGLGLAALLGIVRGHKGAVHVSSSEAKGSTFTILLPIRELPREAVEKQTVFSDPSAPGGIQKSGCILFVDDEELVREVGRVALSNAGFKVVLAENGRHALEVFAERAATISAVVLDMMMPELDGLETFRELRRRQPALKGILSSGYSNDVIIKSWQEEGLHGFLKKPYRPDELTDLLTEVLTA